MGKAVSVTEILKKVYKKDVSGFDVTFLKKSVNNRISETKCTSLNEYLELIEKNKQEKDRLIQSLNISYSEFFRNGLTFSVLEQIVLPLLILKKQESKRKEIRIWSAACAGGQEAYSLAMLMEEITKGEKEKISYRIFATDLNDQEICKAQKGMFSPDELNNMTLKRVNKWLTKTGDNYSIKKELKKNINFSVFDLFSEQFTCPPESIFGDFDVVVCANLLFYYKPEFRKIILAKTTNCLAKGGYLVTGETERDILLKQNHNELFPQSAIFQIK